MLRKLIDWLLGRMPTHYLLYLVEREGSFPFDRFVTPFQFEYCVPPWLAYLFITRRIDKLRTLDPQRCGFIDINPKPSTSTNAKLGQYVNGMYAHAFAAQHQPSLTQWNRPTHATTKIHRTHRHLRQMPSRIRKRSLLHPLRDRTVDDRPASSLRVPVHLPEHGRRRSCLRATSLPNESGHEVP